MKVPTHPANPVLAVLLQHSGYGSLDEFGAAINTVGAATFGLKLRYDYMAVQRWLRGCGCQHPDVVAKTLTLAWGVDIPAAAIFPRQRRGAAPAPPHLWPAAAQRTLDELATFIGSDMLTRRAALTAAITTTVGTALTDPLLRWLPLPTNGLPPQSGTGRSQVTMSTVAEIEKATSWFGAQDASVGGGLSREAAVGQLRYAVDLLRDGRYSDAVGDRMLLAVADLARLAGWMSHDIGMDGPGQRYLTLGLHAARESHHPRAHLSQAAILATMARQLHALSSARAALDLVDAAIARVPHGHGDAAMLWNLRARVLASHDPGCLTELTHCIGLAEDLFAAGGNTALSPYAGQAELAGNAALAWQAAAAHRPELASRAADAAQAALKHRPTGFNRSVTFDRILLSKARFTMREPDQGAVDGHAAVDLAETVPQSRRVLTRLRALLPHTDAYATRPDVAHLRDRLTTHLAAGT